MSSLFRLRENNFEQDIVFSHCYRPCTSNVFTGVCLSVQGTPGPVPCPFWEGTPASGPSPFGGCTPARTGLGIPPPQRQDREYSLLDRRQGVPPPPGQGYQPDRDTPHPPTGEQVMLCRRMYPSCGHAGGLFDFEETDKIETKLFSRAHYSHAMCQ